jgi:hypothetical protein
MVAHIITSAILSKPTMLQVALGVLAHDKKLIEHLHDYGITSTYQEVRRYKVSAAVSSGSLSLNLQSSDGLIQIISDNFDAHIHSQNGMKQTNGLATIITQSVSGSNNRTDFNPKIPRLREEELKS